jgi:acylglycerol lipase
LSKGATEVLSKSSGLNMPIFFGHGTRDDITAFEVTRNFAHKIGQNATFFSVAGARHELHHEPAADQLFAKLAYWIKATMKTSEKGLEHVV